MDDVPRANDVDVRYEGQEDESEELPADLVPSPSDGSGLRGA